MPKLRHVHFELVLFVVLLGEQQFPAHPRRKDHGGSGGWTNRRWIPRRHGTRRRPCRRLHHQHGWLPPPPTQERRQLQRKDHPILETNRIRRLGRIDARWNWIVGMVVVVVVVSIVWPNDGFVAAAAKRLNAILEIVIALKSIHLLEHHHGVVGLKPPRRYRTAEFSIRRIQEPHTPKHVSESRVIACTAGPILSTRESAILVLMLTKIPSKSHRAFTQAILSKRDFAIALIIRMCDRTRKSKDSTSSFCPSYP